MIIPNISLAFQVAELAPIFNESILRKIQELDNGWLKLRFQTKQGTKDLIATPEAIFITSFSMPARKLTSGYGAFLKKKIVNKKVVAFRQHGLDRVLEIVFEDFFLIFELFAKGNVILTDESLKTVSAFRKEQWKDRVLRKGEQYKFPASKGVSPLDLNEKTLLAFFSKSDSDIVRTVVKEVNIAPQFAEEACLNAGLEKEAKANSVKKASAVKLVKAIKELYFVKAEKAKPIIVEKGNKKILLPFSLKGLEKGNEFSSMNEAIDSVYSAQFSKEKVGAETLVVGKKKAELQKSMEQQKEALETLNKRIEDNAKKAELIYANYAEISELLKGANIGVDKKIKEKEIMYKLKSRFPFLQSVNLKDRKLTVDLKK